MEVGFSQSYYETLPEYANPSGVPLIWPVSIAGRTYLVDTSFEPYRRDAFRHRSIQSQRQSIDLTNIPGEGTINTEGLWRRAAIDWHLGAGQPYQDRKGSEEARFEESKGVNPWMQWQLSLLNDTKQVAPSTGQTQALQVGQFVYVLDVTAQTLKFTSDLTTYTTVTGTPSIMAMIATDGYNVWIANNISYGTSGTGLYATTAGAASVSSFVTVTAGGYDGVWWVGERLMATSGAGVYNILAAGTSPTALWSHPDFNWRITAMAQGASQIYISGYDPGAGFPLKSTVFRTTIQPAGTNLTVPVQALPLEGGEYVTALYGYLNFMFLGTNLGIRMCRTLSQYDPTGNAGDLEAGPLIPGLYPPGPVSLPVRAIVGNNRFIYFGWSNYDNVSTGIGRLDISTFIDTQAPAFTSDLMVTGTGEVTSLDWSTINNAPLICVRGSGVWTDSGATLATGFVDSGLIGFGISDDKILMAGDIGTLSPQQGTVTMSIAVDNTSDNSLALVGTQRSGASGGSGNQSPFSIGQLRGEQYSVRMTLARDPVTNQSPILHRWTIKAFPAITAGTTISVVLCLWKQVDLNGYDRFTDPYVEKAFLENLRRTQTVVQYVEGPYSTQAVIDEIDWLPTKQRDQDPQGGYQGDCIVYLKTWDIGS